MYNYGTAAEVLDTVFDIIEGGKAVEAAKVAEVVADNGAKIFDITTSEAFAANGSAATIGSTVSIAEGATAGTTAGAGALTMDVATAASAVAPALGCLAAGVAGGFALYNLAPDFWTSLSNDLVSAGQTVGGKVMGLLMPDGTTALSGETINIIKNKLLDAGAFNNDYEVFTNEIAYNSSLHTSPQQLGTYLMTVTNDLARDTGYISAADHANNLTKFPNWISQLQSAINNLSQSSCYWFGVPLIKRMNGVDIAIGLVGIKDSVGMATANWVYNYDPDSGDGVRVSFGRTLNIIKMYAQGAGNSFSIEELLANQVEFIGGWFSIISGYYRFYTSANYIQKTQENSVLPRLGEDFQVTYPNWKPYEFPQTLPVEMPDYYPVSMPTPDITQDPAQEGANETDTQLNKLIELLFQNLPENAPQIEPDFDPDPEPDPEPEPEPTRPEPEPNPPDPNPPVPDPIPTIPLPTLNTTRADRMFTVYNPTDGNVNSLGAFLWTNSVIEQIKKLWDDPMQAIISFHKIYGAPTVGSSQEIVLGYIESGVSAPVVTSQFCEADCGSVTVPELLNNATSYAPFTSLHIYLPFIGIMELDTNECMKATLHVKYRIDVYTGTCIALIYVSRNPDLTHEQVLYTFSGNASQQLPLTSSSFGGAISALLGLAGAGVAVASGGALGVAAGAVSAAHSLTQEMVHINRSGGLSANAGILGSRTPYLILSRQYCSDANGYAGFYGYPSNKTVYIGNCNGYIKCKDVIFRGSCTQAEAEEIESLLKSGVYV